MTKQLNILNDSHLKVMLSHKLNILVLVIFSLCFNSQALSQDTLKSEGFLIVDFDSFYFLPIKSSFAKKKSIDFKDFKFKKGFNLSLTYDYYDNLTRSKGTKFLMYPSVTEEKYKYPLCI